MILIKLIRSISFDLFTFLGARHNKRIRAIFIHFDFMNSLGMVSLMNYKV